MPRNQIENAEYADPEDVSSNQVEPSNYGVDGDGYAKKDVGWCKGVKICIVWFVALATMLSFILSIILVTKKDNTQWIIYITAGCAFCAAPLAVINERRLAKQESFRDLMNDLKDESDLLKLENDRISDSIDNLQQSAEEVEEIEGGLNEMAKSQGADVQQLLRLVNSNKRCQSQMKDIIRLKAGQDLITLVLECDQDENFKISGAGIDELVYRVSSLDSAKIDEKRFREEVTKRGGNVDLIIDMVNKTVSEEETEVKDFVQMADSVVYLESMRSQLFSEAVPRGRGW